MKLISKLTFTSAVLALAFVSVASAESMRVSVPFGFRACGQTLPAGVYKVDLNLMNQRIALLQLDGKAGCYLPVKAYTGPGAPEHGTIVFNRYGDRHFLSRVNARGVRMGATVFTDRAERELAKVEGAAKTVQVPASSM